MSNRQPGHPPHLHSDGPILPLDVRRADVLRVGIAKYDSWDRPYNVWWRIPALSSMRGGVELRQLGEVHTISQVADDGFDVGLESSVVMRNRCRAVTHRRALMRVSVSLFVRRPNRVARVAKRMQGEAVPC